MSYQQLLKLKGSVGLEPLIGLEHKSFSREISIEDDACIEVAIRCLLDKNPDFTEEQLATAKEPDDELLEWLDQLEAQGSDPEIIWMSCSTSEWFTIDSKNNIEWPSQEMDGD